MAEFTTGTLFDPDDYRRVLTRSSHVRLSDKHRQIGRRRIKELRQILDSSESTHL